METCFIQLSQLSVSGLQPDDGRTWTALDRLSSTNQLVISLRRDEVLNCVYADGKPSAVNSVCWSLTTFRPFLHIIRMRVRAFRSWKEWMHKLAIITCLSVAIGHLHNFRHVMAIVQCAWVEVLKIVCMLKLLATVFIVLYINRLLINRCTVSVEIISVLYRYTCPQQLMPYMHAVLRSYIASKLISAWGINNRQK